MSEKNQIPWEREVIERLLQERLPRKRYRWLKWAVALISIYVVFRLLSAFFAGEVFAAQTPHIAILNLSGTISSSQTLVDNFSEGLKNIGDNEKHVRAMVITANSPGGSPVISDTLYQEIRHFRRVHPKIPVYTVIGDICASGCYYIASASNAILANPSSLVGSIGVIMLGFDATELAAKLGIKDRTQIAGRNKAMGHFLKKESEEEKTIIQEVLKETDHHFIEAVKKGRGPRLKWQKYEDLFTGRIYSGEGAMKVGLIDGYGTLYSVSRAIMKDPVLIDYMPKNKWLDYLNEFVDSHASSFIDKSLDVGSIPRLR